MEKKCNKAKWLSEEALQIAVKRREVKSKGEKERYTHLNADLQDLLELKQTNKKRCPFHPRGLKCKSRNSRDNWSNRQVWPWSTE